MKRTKTVKISKDHIEEALRRYLDPLYHEGNITNVDIIGQKWKLEVTLDTKETPKFREKKNNHAT